MCGVRCAVCGVRYAVCGADLVEADEEQGLHEEAEGEVAAEREREQAEQEQLRREGAKRWGRKRKTVYTCATSVDTTDFGTAAQALRERNKRHEKCEELSFNGILTQLPYSDLQIDLHASK